MDSIHLYERLEELIERSFKRLEALERHDTGALLDYGQAAHILGIKDRRLKAFVSSGELPVIDVGGSVRIHPKALDAFIRERVRGGR